MFIVEVKTRGIYNNIETGARIFLTKKSAVEFSNDLDKVQSKHTVKKVAHLVGDCFAGVYPYYKDIDMFDYECDDTMSDFKYFIYKTFKKYNRKVMLEYFENEEEG